MEPLFEGGPRSLPQRRHPIGRWTITAEDFAKAPPPPVRHALGYDAFVTFAARYGTAAETLFDLWAFAHFLRAHRGSFVADHDLLESAVVFLGNVCIANHPECYWNVNGSDLAVESPQEFVDDEQGVRLEPADRRYLGVGGTVPAILEADEVRFLEFGSVVEGWRPGAPVRRLHRDERHDGDRLR